MWEKEGGYKIMCWYNYKEDYFFEIVLREGEKERERDRERDRKKEREIRRE